MEKLNDVKLKGVCVCGNDKFDVKSVFGNIHIPKCTKCGKIHNGKEKINLVIDKD